MADFSKQQLNPGNLGADESFLSPLPKEPL